MNSTTNTSNSMMWRSILQGAVGFALGAVVALIFLLLSRLIPLEKLLLRWIPEDQKFWGLLGIIFLALLTLTISGVLMGLVGGWTLWRIDDKAVRRRYLWAGGVAYGVGQLILLLFLLLLALASVVNNEPALHISRFLVLFGIFGLVYGLIAGFWLGLVSLGWRHFWRVWLAAAAGYTAGGLMLGLMVWLAAHAADREMRLLGLLALLVGILAIFAAGGAALGWVYHWVAERRAAQGGIPMRMSPGWMIVGIVVLALFGVLVFRVSKTLVQFVTVKEGSLSEVIGLSTTGVAWSDTLRMDAGANEPVSDPAMAGGAGSMAVLAWAQGGDIFLSQGEVASGDVQAVWGTVQNVTLNPATPSGQPRAAALADGSWAVVWVEGGETPAIWYNECGREACGTAVKLAQPDAPVCAGGELKYPALAIDAQGNRLVAWQEGESGLAFSAWGPDQAIPAGPTGCLAAGPVQGALSLSAAGDGVFSLAYSDGVTVYTNRFADSTWQAEAESIGSGSTPTAFHDRERGLHLAWCGGDRALVYQAPDNVLQQVATPQCIGRPVLAQDADGRIHLAWYSDQVVKSSGVIDSGHFIFESILQDGTLTEPAIAARLAGAAQPALANDANGTLYLAWVGGEDNATVIQQATQVDYECLEPPRTTADQAILESIIAGGMIPEGEIPYCGNRFERIAFLPEPPPSIKQPATPYGAFDTLDALVASARYEVLFTVMEYQGDQNTDSPGFKLAEATYDLYQRVHANPQEFPRGMTVRILLGNYPNLATFEWGDQIYYVLDDLKAAGLPTMYDPELGWKVEIANFDGQFPHGHTKFVVVDGQTAISNGYNYSYLHLDKEHSSGLGESLIDLGLQISGPVAQSTLANYDDLWDGANQLVCENLDPPGGDWDEVCEWQTAAATHVPEVLKYYLPGENEAAFSLLRTAAHPLADQAVPAAIRSAKKSLDFFQVNFSMDIICWLNLVNPSFCTFEDHALPYMEAIVDAVEQNRVPTRVIFTDLNSNGIENFIATDVLRAELERRGLSDLVEIRYWPERMHAKAILVDGETLIIGSQNMHYSSFGDNGLTELDQSTDNAEAIRTFMEAFEFWWEQSLPVE